MRDVWLAVVDAGCRLALRLYPADFRIAYQDDIRTTLREQCVAARRRGRIGAALASCAELWTLIGAARANRNGRRSPNHLHPQRREPMRSILQDFRMAVRSLLASRSHAALAVGILAVGIGVTSAVFSIADSVLFRPVPFANADRYVAVWNFEADSKLSFPGMPVPLFQEWRGQTDLFERLEGFDAQSFILSGAAETEMISGAIVTPGLLHMLGVAPIQGRLFVSGEGRAGSDHVIVISERLWRSRFGADPRTVGSRVTLNGEPFEIVGIMPSRFRFPYSAQRIWRPIDPEGPPSSMASARLDAVGVVARGVDRTVIAGQIEARGNRLHRASGQDGTLGARMGDMGGVDATTRRSLIALLAAVGFVLLIACANLANLSLSRALARTHELAIRSALGASRVRLMREALAESLLLGAAGAGMGLGVAWLALQATLAWTPESMLLSSLNAIDIDGRVLLFTSVVAFVTVVLFGLPSALIGSRRAVATSLRTESRSTTGPSIARRIRHTLVVGEVAVSLVLLIGAALMIRSVVKLENIDKGFDHRGLLSLSIGMPSASYADPLARDRFIARLLERAAGLPGIRSVTAGAVPPDSDGIRFGLYEFDTKPGEFTEPLILPVHRVWTGYFDTVGIRILEGRQFEPADPQTAVIVSEDFAARFWPGERAIGRRFRSKGSTAWHEVIGVAAAVRGFGLTDERGSFELYYPMRRPAGAPPAKPRPTGDPIIEYRSVVVRTDDVALVAPALRRAVAELDRSMVIWKMSSVEDLYAEELARPRLVLLLMTVFGGLGLALAAAGVYGVLSYLVTQRLREIGVRMALGARPRDVAALVMRNGLTLVTVGVVLGLAASSLLLKYIRSLLYDVEPTDPVSLVVVAAILMFVALAAASRPALRAMRVDPLRLLREP